MLNKQIKVLGSKPVSHFIAFFKESYPKDNRREGFLDRGSISIGGCL